MKHFKWITFLIACSFAVRLTFCRGDTEGPPADRVQVVQQLQTVSRCLTNAWRLIAESSLKERVAFSALLTDVQRVQAQAISNLSVGAQMPLKWHERGYIVLKQGDGGHYTFDFWRPFSVLQSIKLRNSGHSLQFHARYYTNGLPQSFSWSQPERFVEFYVTGKLKRMSYGVKSGSYHEAQWTEAGIMELEGDFTPPARIRQ